MKREFISAALLVLLFGICLANLGYVDSLIDGICDHVESSADALRDGDTNLAVSELETAIELWSRAENYTHVFIRHSEIDAVTDEFYSLKSSLVGSQAAGEEDYLQLLYHLENVEKMEQLRLGSIF